MIIQFFWALKFKNGGKNVQLIFNSYIYTYIYIYIYITYSALWVGGAFSIRGP